MRTVTYVLSVVLVGALPPRSECAKPLGRLRNSSAGVVFLQHQHRLQPADEQDDQTIHRQQSTGAASSGGARSKLWVSLDLPKHLWAAGFDAKFSPVPEQPVRGEWLTWTPKAEEIFAKHYNSVMFPAEGCRQRAESRGYFAARTDMEWGVTSVIRDVEDQLLYGLLEGKFVAFSKGVDPEPRIQDAMRQYRDQCGGNGIWMEECYFEKITGCTDDFLSQRLPWHTEKLDRRLFKVTSEPAWFMERSQPIWDEMVKADAVRWHSNKLGDHNVSGDAARWSFSHVSLAEMEDDVQNLQLRAAQRLGMFRALLLKVAFRPNKALLKAIKEVEIRTGLPEVAPGGPLTVVHVRRTDKSKDFIGGTQSAEEKAAFDGSGSGGVAATLGTFADTLLPWVEGAKGPISSLFVMSDDWHAFQPEALDALTRGLKRQPTNVLFDSKSKELEPQDEKTLQMGNEAWGNKAQVGRYILASSFALGKWADNIVGCGSSGVTQLVAQLMGGRLGVDPNSLGMFEDDSLNVDAAREADAPAAGYSFLAMDLDKVPESRAGRSFWRRMREAVSSIFSEVR